MSKLAIAKSIVDCRVMIGSTTECNPYGKRFHYVNAVVYDKGRKKQQVLHIISVKEMVKDYVSIHEFIYFPSEHSKTLTENIIVFKPKVPEIPQIIKTVVKQKKIIYADYVVVKGDSLSKVSKKLGLRISHIKKLNALTDTSTLSIGQKLKTPFEQSTMNALLKAQYNVKKGDTLLSIAKLFQLPAKDIVMLNHIKSATAIKEGKLLKLPLPYILDRLDTLEEEKGYKTLGNSLDINAFGTQKLRVTATAYTSHANQTDDTPFLAAWNNELRPGMKIVAVSRDLLIHFGMRNGTKVRISGLKGVYKVRDKMNKRYKKRIDIYMGLSLEKALHWGRRSVVIYW